MRISVSERIYGEYTLIETINKTAHALLEADRRIKDGDNIKPILNKLKRKGINLVIEE